MYIVYILYYSIPRYLRFSHFVCLMGGLSTKGNHPKKATTLQSAKGGMHPPKRVICRIRDPGHQVMMPRPWDIPWSGWSNWDQPSSPP